MRYCPECRAEYATDISVCPDCDTLMAESSEARDRHASRNDVANVCPECRAVYDNVTARCPDCDVLLIDDPDAALKFTQVRSLRDLWRWIRAGKPLVPYCCPKCKGIMQEGLDHYTRPFGRASIPYCRTCNERLRRNLRREALMVLIGALILAIVAAATSSPSSADAAFWLALFFGMLVTYMYVEFATNRRVTIGSSIVGVVVASILWLALNASVIHVNPSAANNGLFPFLLGKLEHHYWRGMVIAFVVFGLLPKLVVATLGVMFGFNHRTRQIHRSGRHGSS